MFLYIMMWILRIVSTILNIYAFMIVIYTLLTWVPKLLHNPVGNLLARLVEPYLGWFERFIPPVAGISFAPVVALLVVYFVNNYVLVWIANIIIKLVYR